VLGLFPNFRPVLFPDIGIDFNDQRTLVVQTAQSITTWTRNPILRAAFSVVVVRFEAAALEASERSAFVGERASSPVESERPIRAGPFRPSAFDSMYMMRDRMA